MRTLKLVIVFFILYLACSCSASKVIPEGCKPAEKPHYKMVKPAYDKKVKL